MPHMQVQFVGVVLEAGADLAPDHFLVPVAARRKIGAESLDHTLQAEAPAFAETMCRRGVSSTCPSSITGTPYFVSS